MIPTWLFFVCSLPIVGAVLLGASAIGKVRRERDDYKRMLSRYRTEELGAGSQKMAESALIQGLFDNRKFRPDFGIITSSDTWNSQISPWLESELLYDLFEACNAPDDKSKLESITSAKRLLKIVLKPQQEIDSMGAIEKFREQQERHRPQRR